MTGLWEVVAKPLSRVYDAPMGSALFVALKHSSDAAIHREPLSVQRFSSRASM